MLQLLIAFLAGVLTIAAPCILLPLPILLGASVGRSSRTRPLFITLGFIAAFSVLALFLNTLTRISGLSANSLRNIAVVLLALFGLVMLWPAGYEKLSAHFSGLINRAARFGQRNGSGNAGGFVIGLILGVIWAPCAGPVLASILALIAVQTDVVRAAGLLIAYAIGAGIPMLLVAYGGQVITTKVRWIARYGNYLQQGFGVIIILLAVAVYLQYDVKLEAQLVNYLPMLNIEDLTQQKNSANFGPVELSDQGPAPEFQGISHWINSNPLTMQQLRGKVVLVDFWTYSCINCIRTLPFVTGWYDKYKDQGLVIIGVHTPEFAFEKVTDNVAAATQRFNINYPVAQDNDYGTWNAFHNQYWPAEYLIDQNGHIVYTHFGEGEYDHTEDAIRQLLGLSANLPAQNGQDLSQVGSPEMYFGLNRLEFMSNTQRPSAQAQQYSIPQDVPLNTFALDGFWQLDPEKATLTRGSGKIKLHFNSGKVHFVAAADHPITVKVFVDGKLVNNVTIQQSQLYTLFDSQDYNSHTLELEIPEAGLSAFTFTFG